MKKQTKLGLVLAAAAVLSVSVASLVSAKGWVQQGSDWFYLNNEDEKVAETIQSSGNAKFYLGEDGAMMKDYFLENYDDNTYYFGSNGAMVTNTWVAIEAGRVEEGFENYEPDNYWYYFQSNGKAAKGTDTKPKTMTIDGKKYMFNKNGQMLVGWFDADGVVQDPDDSDGNPFDDALYYAGGDNDGVLRTGWVTYYDGFNGDDDQDYLTDKTNLYFYFNTSNNKKYANEKKNINNKTYVFSPEGVMLSGWDVFEHGNGILSGKTTYFSGEDDGHQVKKGWVFTVPASGIDQGAYDDGEDKYMYFGSSGDAEKDNIKKINSKWYCFAPNGIMKTGLVMWTTQKIANFDTNTATKYVDKLDLDYAEGSDVAKKGKLTYDDGKYYMVKPDGALLSKYDGSATTTLGGQKVKLHLFGDDGARKTGTNTVQFSDDEYSFYSNNQGDRGSGKVSKKYYSLGILLKASSDLKYGIYANTYSDTNKVGKFNAQKDNYGTGLEKGRYNVLNTSGQMVDGNNAAKKDADGNYWYIEKNTDVLRGIFDCEIKANNTSSFESKYKYYATIEDLLNAKLISTSNDNKSINIPQNYKSVDYASLSNLYISDSSASGDVTDELDKDEFDENDGKIVFQLSGIKRDTTGTLSSDEVVTFTLKVKSNNGLVYKSDYDGSSKSLPFGWLDDAGKTASLELHDSDLDTYHQILPDDNSYFTNCYWLD